MAEFKHKDGCDWKNLAVDFPDGNTRVFCMKCGATILLTPEDKIDD